VTAGTEARAHGGTGNRFLSRAAVPLCLCAAMLHCTDPRARVPPPLIQITIPPALQVRSPGSIPASIYCADFQGFDSLRVTLRSATAPQLAGDSLYLFPDTTAATTDVLWNVPSGIPAGTEIVLHAKVWNLVGFAAADSVILTSK